MGKVFSCTCRTCSEIKMASLAGVNLQWHLMFHDHTTQSSVSSLLPTPNGHFQSKPVHHSNSSASTVLAFLWSWSLLLPRSNHKRIFS